MIGIGKQGAWLSSAETQATEKTLTLPDSQNNTMLLLKVMTEEFSVPEVLSIPLISGRLSQVLSNASEALLIQYWRATFPWDSLQSGKATLLESLHPILKRTRTVPENFRCLDTTDTRTDKQYSMKTVVIAGFLGPENFLLYGNTHDLCIFDFQFTHDCLLLISISKERYYAQLFMSLCIKTTAS